MDPQEFAALNAQKAAQDKEMAAMMAEYGVGDAGAGKDDMAALFKEMGLEDPGPKQRSEEDELMAKIMAQADGNPEDLTDEALLAELAGELPPRKSPEDEASELIGKVDDLLVEIKQLMAQGKKPEAAAKLRDRKAAEAALAEIYSQDPTLKARVSTKKEIRAAPAQASQPKPVAKPKLALSILEIYETYHDPELLQSVAVIDAELGRCNGLLSQLAGDAELTEAMTARIEILEMQKESIESDIQNEFLDVAGYLDQIKQYYREESANFKKAKSDGLDQENLDLIQGRINNAKQEIAEVTQGMQQQAAAEAEEEREVEQSEQERAVEEAKEVQEQPAQAEAPVSKQAGGAVKFDQGMYDLIVERKNKYAVAAKYCRAELGNNELLMQAIEAAEQCAGVASNYKATGQIDKAKLAPGLTPEKLFGLSAAEKSAKYDEIILELEQKCTALQDTARKCLDGSKKVKKQLEIANLRAMASTKIGEAKATKEKVARLKAQKENPWSAPPDVQKVTTSKNVPKINQDLEQDEFEVEIPESESLYAAKLKTVKVKIKDAQGKELVGHYFTPHEGAETSAIMKIPTSMQQNFKTQKLMIACKDHKNMFWEENRHKTDLSMVKLSQNNEIRKEVKFNKIKFEVILRIRQAVFKKEMEAVESSQLVLKKLFMPFDEFEKKSAAAEPARVVVKKPAAPVKTPQLKPQPVQQPSKPKPVSVPAATVPSAPPSNLSPADIADVENESLLVCASYCERRIAQINASLARCIKDGVRADPKERAVLKLAMKSKAVIEAGCQGGQITIAEYDGMLAGLMRRDQELTAYFGQIKDMKKYEICSTRFKCAKEERAELAPHLEGQ